MVVQKQKRKLLFARLSLYVCFSVLAISCVFAISSCKDKKEKGEAPLVRPDADYALLLDLYTIEDYSSDIKVYDANNEEVVVDKNGKFLIRTPGTYTIEYEEKTSYLYAFAKIPESEFVYDSELSGKEFVAGDLLSLPTCNIENAVKNYDEYQISLMKGEMLLQTFDGAVSNKYFLSDSGEYEAVYSFQNVFGKTESNTLAFTVVDQERIVLEQEVPQEILLGSKLEFKNYGYYLKNKYESVLTVEKPSGEVSTQNDVLFDELGEYRLSFSSTIDGKDVCDVYTVNTVMNSTLLFTNANKINFIREGELNSLCLDSSGKAFSENTPALEISAVDSNSSIYYSGIIDLKNKTAEMPLIELYPDKVSGTINNLQITLIDVVDPSINIRMTWMQHDEHDGLSFARVSANNQIFFGQSSSGYASTDFGTLVGCGYRSGTKSSSFAFSFDWETQSIYQYNDRVAALLEPDKLPNGYVWNGFTTGEVYLRIDFLDCQNGTILVKSVNGIEFSNVDFTTLKDEGSIRLDTEYDVLPTGVKGMAYPIPSVVQNKIAKNSKVKIALYYGSENESALLNVNSFVPESVGTYTLQYSTIDNFGKLVQKSYEIQINEEKTPITITGDFENQTIDIMDYYQVPEYFVSGGHGNKESIVVVKINDKEIVKGEAGYAVTEKGTMKVSIQATDYLGNVETKEYNVFINDDIQIFNYNRLPSSVFVGDTLNFNVSAINYITGNQMTCSVYVNNVKATNSYIVPTGVSELNVIFEGVDGGKIAQSEVITIPVNQKTLTNLRDYIQTDFEAETLILNSGIVYKLAKSEQSYGFRIPYQLSAYEFGLKFGFNAGKSSVSGMQILMQDAQNPEQSIEINLSNLGSQSFTVKVNEDTAWYSTTAMKGTYKSNCGSSENAQKYLGTGYSTISLLFDTFNGIITDAAGVKIAPVKTFRNGKTFTGFESGVILCSFNLTGVSADSEFILSSISNQTFNYLIHGDNSIVDKQAPILALRNRFETTGAIGETYKVPVIEAYDVFSVGAKVTLKVRMPNGDYLADVALDKAYSFVIDKYGTYTLEVTAQDVHGNSATKQFYVKVGYDKAPEFTVNGTVKQLYEIGDILKIPEYTIVDNSDAGDIKMTIILKDQNGIGTVIDGNYKFVEAGIYQLVLRAVDEYYNVTRVVYNVVVEG